MYRPTLRHWFITVALILCGNLHSLLKFHNQYFQPEEHDELSFSMLDGTKEEESGDEETAIVFNRSISQNIFHKEINATHIEPFSACLLIKDENPNLIEWLAYHYQTLPLRHLIVGVDPGSITSPKEILRRWKDYMDIKIWGDDKMMPPTKRNVNVSWNTSESIDIHRVRQAYFYQRCIKYHRVMNRTWTVLIDVDEYMAYHPIGDFEAGDVFYRDMRGKDDVFVPKRKKSENETLRDRALLTARTELPSSIGSQTLSEYIAQNRNQEPWTRICFVIPRLMFGSIEEKDENLLYQHIPYSQFDPMQFQTLRFFRHAKKSTQQPNGPGKSLIDVSRMSKEAVIRQRVRNPHVLNEDCGIRGSGFPAYDTSILLVHHYSGSKEAFFSKTDIRRTSERFDLRANVDAGVNYNLQPWLKSFVSSVGIEKAKELLEDVGEIGDYKHPDDIIEKRDELKEKRLNKNKPKQPKKLSIVFSRDETKDVVSDNDDKYTYVYDPLKHSFSACVFIKDDTENIAEWIAYHYHTLPLHNLLLCVNNKTSTSSIPIQVADRWTSQPMESPLNIEIWDHFDVMPEKHDLTKEKVYNIKAMFYQQCILHHREHGRTWTALIDTDEYITYHTITDTEAGDVFKREKNEQKQDEFVFYENLSKTAEQDLAKMEARIKLTRESINQSTLAEHMTREQRNIPWDSTCIILPRLLFGHVEEDNQEKLNRNIPNGFDPNQFATTRYFRHAEKKNYNLNGAGKSLVDVSKLSDQSLRRDSVRTTNSVHDECGKRGSAFQNYDTSVLLIHRYIRIKDDGMMVNNKKYLVNAGVSYKIQPWLQSFVNEVGLTKAKMLLEEV